MSDAVGDAPKDAPLEVSLGDSGLPPEHEWLADAEIWQLAPGGDSWAPKCWVFEGAAAKLKFPMLSWQSCGDGCQRADVLQGFSKATFPVASSVLLPTGVHAHLMFDVGVEGASSWFVVRRIIGLESGNTVAALERVVGKNTAGCTFGNNREDALASIALGQDQGTSMTWVPTEGKWHWASPVRPLAELPNGLVELTIESPTTVRFHTGKGAVWALLDADKNDWTLLEPSSKSRIGTGQGNLAVWTDYPSPGNERIRGWAPDGKGIRTLLDPVPFETCWAVASPSHIVGLVGESCSTWTDVRFWRAPRTHELSTAAPELSPVLGHGAAMRPKSWGDFAVIALSEPDDAGAVKESNSLLVVQLSTWKAWRIEPTPGLVYFADGLTITDQAIFAGETLNSAGGTILQVKRLELSKLDVLGSLVN